ncbi:MAG: hypothetical protein ACI9OJ_001005 [Myxococcota bacterium]
MKFLTISALIAVLAVPTAATAADKHKPTLRGAVKVGTTFRTRVVRSHAMLENRAELAVFQGQTVLTAVIKVTAVDGSQITGAEITIEDFADAPTRGELRTLPAGTKLVVVREGRRGKISDPSGKLSKKDLQPLNRSKVLSAVLTGAPPWISGPPEAVTNGDTWTLDGKAIGKKLGMGMEKANVKAKAWLNDVSDKSYSIVGELKVDGINVANPKIKSIRSTDGKVAGETTVTVAKDGTGPVLQLIDRKSVWMTITIERDGKDVSTPTVMNTTTSVRNTIL